MCRKLSKEEKKIFDESELGKKIYEIEEKLYSLYTDQKIQRKPFIADHDIKILISTEMSMIHGGKHIIIYAKNKKIYAHEFDYIDYLMIREYEHLYADTYNLAQLADTANIIEDHIFNIEDMINADIDILKDGLKAVEELY